jgi:hypothetical protein
MYKLGDRIVVVESIVIRDTSIPRFLPKGARGRILAIKDGRLYIKFEQHHIECCTEDQVMLEELSDLYN